MNQLFYNKKENKYYLVLNSHEELIKCNHCNKVMELKNILYVHRGWNKKNFKKCYYCVNCIKNNKKMIYDEFIIAIISLDYPEGSFAVLDYPPSMQSRVSVFDAGLSNNGIMSDVSSVKVVNKCKLAGRESLEGAKIGRDIEESETLIDSEKGVDEYLHYLKDLKPAGKKQLDIKE